MTTASTAWTQRVQRNTRATATHNGEGWTTRDIAFVSAAKDTATDEAIALATARTLYSIQSLRKAIQAGKRVGSARVASSDRPYRGWTADMGDE